MWFALIDGRTSLLESESIPLSQAAGRVLATNVRAGFDVPPFDRAAMDGYAVRGEETFGADPYSPASLSRRRPVAAGPPIWRAGSRRRGGRDRHRSRLFPAVRTRSFPSRPPGLKERSYEWWKPRLRDATWAGEARTCKPAMMCLRPAERCGRKTSGC